ncbi:hypothetical protein LCGC14_1474570 [marine sediment metagenome]|uniref:Uncharacterized protein n=1 Tax=marine sediment metagenome TaxID=412755 RepID=A0A0F9MD18_9ZZZZ
MSYITRTKDNPTDIGRSADQQASVDNDVYFRQGVGSGDLGNVIRQVITKTGIPDNVATEIFTITTTDETGENDAGVYACYIRGVVSHVHDTDVHANWTAASFWSGFFSRAVGLNAGGGVNSSLTEIEGAVTAPNPGVRTLTTITGTVVETSEYVNSVEIQIDLTGSDVDQGVVVFAVELVWYGFLTTPVIAGV